LHVLAGGADIVGTVEISDLSNGVLETDGSGVVSATALTEHALMVGDSSGNISFLTVGDTGQVLQANTTADPDWSTTTYPSTSVIGDVLVASADNTITTLAAGTATYTLTSNGAGSAPSWQPDPAGAITWNEVAGTTQAMASGNGYIPKNGALTTFTLPYPASIGDVVAITGFGAGGWDIVNGLNEPITLRFLGSAVTGGIGATCHLSSTTQFDCVELVMCDNTVPDVWVVRSAVGNLSLTTT